MRWWSCVGACLLFLVACDKGNNTNAPADIAVGLGHRDANSELPEGLYAPIGPSDLVELQERGRSIAVREHVLDIGYHQGAFKVGVPDDEIIMPLVNVDPGERSGQVLFFRWPPDKIPADGALTMLDAERWLLVSMLLSPDRVLDVELLSGPVKPGEEWERAGALLRAAKAMADEAPEQEFALFAYPELHRAEKAGKPSRILTRVYCLATDPMAADYEVLVDAPHRNKKKPREIVKVVQVHKPGITNQEPIVLDVSQPSPLTVARVMTRGPSAGVATVKTPQGTWTIEPRSGRVTRQAAASSRSGAEEISSALVSTRTPSQPPADGEAAVQ